MGFPKSKERSQPVVLKTAKLSPVYKRQDGACATTYSSGTGIGLIFIVNKYKLKKIYIPNQVRTKVIDLNSSFSFDSVCQSESIQFNMSGTWTSLTSGLMLLTSLLLVFHQSACESSIDCIFLLEFQRELIASLEQVKVSCLAFILSHSIYALLMITFINSEDYPNAFQMQLSHFMLATKSTDDCVGLVMER